MKIVAKLELKPAKEIMQSKGLGLGGEVQKFIDSECIRMVSPYVPFRTGMLDKSATINTVIGDGEIIQNTPYARYQYYGKVMTTKDGRTYARLGEEKPIITDRDLVYSKAAHPQAGSFWWLRFKADKKDELLNEVKAYCRKLNG